MNPLAVFRDHSGTTVALFPEIPASKRPRECLAYSVEKGFHAQDYDSVMFHSRSAKTHNYRELLASIKKLGYEVNLIQKASPIMIDRRNDLQPTFDTQQPINQFLQGKKKADGSRPSKVAD